MASRGDWSAVIPQKLYEDAADGRTTAQNENPFVLARTQIRLGPLQDVQGQASGVREAAAAFESYCFGFLADFFFRDEEGLSEGPRRPVRDGEPDFVADFQTGYILAYVCDDARAVST